MLNHHQLPFQSGPVVTSDLPLGPLGRIYPSMHLGGVSLKTTWCHLVVMRLNALQPAVLSHSSGGHRTGTTEPGPQNRGHRIGATEPGPQNRGHRTGATELGPQNRDHRIGTTELKQDFYSTGPLLQGWVLEHQEGNTL